MNKFCGIISYLCGSVAIALLAIALITGGGRQAWASPCTDACGAEPTAVAQGQPGYAEYQSAYSTWQSCVRNCSPPCNCGPQPGGSAGGPGSPWYNCMLQCWSNANPGVGIDCDLLGFILPCNWFKDCIPSRPNCNPVTNTSYCACSAGGAP